MADSKYCYPDSSVLINKLNIMDDEKLYDAELKLALIRLLELQNNPVKGKLDFTHLKAIHRYIFQDIYDWAGKIRTVDIGKGNLFCTVRFIDDYARSVFAKYFPSCNNAKDSRLGFIKTLAENYGDLNALHPFREGNGRAQREFARLVCLECGYYLDWFGTSHNEMLAASKLSFDKGDSSGFLDIFSRILIPINEVDNNYGNEIEIVTAEER